MKVLIWSDIHMGHSHNTYRIYEKFIIKKVIESNFDIVVLCGDLISSKQKSLETLFKLLRRHIPDKPIYWVRGNHDFWNGNEDKKYNSYVKMMNYHRAMSNKYRIWHLEDSPVVFDDYVFFGFDGWYGYEPKTNDSVFMNNEKVSGYSLHDFLCRKAHNELDQILKFANNDYEDKIKVCVSHFPPYTRDPIYRHMIANENYLGYIGDIMDFFFVGHSHKDEDWFFRKSRIINCGNDYDKPKCKIIDLSNKSIKSEVLTFNNRSKK